MAAGRPRDDTARIRAGLGPRGVGGRRFADDTARAIRNHNCTTAGCYRDGYGTTICTAFES